MRYRFALAVFAMVVAGAGVSAAQPVASDLSGHWMMTITMTQGNSADQALLGQSADLRCGQSGTLMTCWSRDGDILVSGRRDPTTIQMSGTWNPQGLGITYFGESALVHMTLDGRLVDPALMEGHFDADIVLGLGTYRASGEWKAVKVK